MYNNKAFIAILITDKHLHAKTNKITTIWYLAIAFPLGVWLNTEVLCNNKDTIDVLGYTVASYVAIYIVTIEAENMIDSYR